MQCKQNQFLCSKINSLTWIQTLLHCIVTCNVTFLLSQLWPNPFYIDANATDRWSNRNEKCPHKICAMVSKDKHKLNDKNWNCRSRALHRSKLRNPMRASAFCCIFNKWNWRATIETMTTTGLVSFYTLKR